MREKQPVEIICLGVGSVVGLVILMHYLPYLILFLALCGGYYLYEESRKNRR